MSRFNPNKRTYRCSQCGHNWNPKKVIPKECPNPKCKSSDWNKPKIKKITVPSTTTKTTKTGQVGVKIILGIPIPEASIKIEQEVTKKN